MEDADAAKRAFFAELDKAAEDAATDDDLGDEFAEYAEESLEWANLSYFDKVNAPLTEATVEALKAELASGNPARYRRPRNPAENSDEASGALFASMRTQPYQKLVEEVTAASQGYHDPLPPDPPQAVWRIWSNRRRKWYLPEARGYTPNIEESGRFMPMEALQIYGDAARGWAPDKPFTIDITLVPA